MNRGKKYFSMNSLKTIVILSIITLIISLGIEYYHSTSNKNNEGFSIKRWIFTMIPLYIFQFGSLYMSSFFDKGESSRMLGGFHEVKENIENVQNAINKVQEVNENMEQVSGYVRKKKNKHHNKENRSIFAINGHSLKHSRHDEEVERNVEEKSVRKEETGNISEERNNDIINSEHSEHSDNEEEENRKKDFNIKTDMPTF